MEGPLLTEREHIINITNDRSSPSTDGQQPHEFVELGDPYTNENVWNSIEFVVTLALIAAAIIVLIQPRDEEHPQIVLFIGIIGYTCGCVATLPILCWRFWHYNRSVGPESIDQYLREKRINKRMDHIMMCFFLGWFVVFLWICTVHVYISSALEDTTSKFLWLCVALLTFSCIRYVFSNLTMAVVCYTTPLLILTPVVVCVLLVVEVLKAIGSCIVECIC
ncbi:PREDICTED: uncharacterized protein LOC104755877 [Camelina sativa]|uniref:Uncharacterized protein LOC104755877 n=1 Tax=Camelina sativa TaxID=90675 RepID=A0ABM0WV78_CAMSA|nr:PREDICTED: uncharacterized protein LOC104755877 [Camelina sativa]